MQGTQTATEEQTQNTQQQRMPRYSRIEQKIIQKQPTVQKRLLDHVDVPVSLEGGNKKQMNTMCFALVNTCFAFMNTCFALIVGHDHAFGTKEKKNSNKTKNYVSSQFLLTTTRSMMASCYVILVNILLLLITTSLRFAHSKHHLAAFACTLLMLQSRHSSIPSYG